MRASPRSSTRSTARSTASAAAGSCTWRSSIAPDRIIAIGFATPLPAMSGALPWTGSNTAYSHPRFAPAARPSPPTSPAHRSEMMSPYRFGSSRTSNAEGSRTSRIESWSISISSNHTSGCPSASICPIDRNSPSENRMMFALWPRVTFRRPCARTYSSANRTIRRAPVTEIGLTVNPESSRSSRPESRRSSSRSSSASGVPFSNSIPWYRSSVFSRITTRSTSGWRVGSPASEREGRTAANRSSVCRSSTFTLRNPEPTGVVIGPLIATRESRIRSRTRSGSVVPSRARTSAPASSTTHSIGTPVASRTRRVASETSGPMPSPGMSVTRCATAEPYRASGARGGRAR